MAFSDPAKNVSQFGLGSHMRVADLGAGSGAYAIAAARAVSSGAVYAVDIQQGLVSRIKQAAAERGLTNIFPVWGDLEEPGGSKLADDLVEAVIIANTLFQVGHKKTFLQEAFRILKPSGKLLLVDWTDSFGGLGPHQNDVVRERDARQLLEEAGLVYVSAIDAGDHHYGMIMKKSPR